MKDNKFYVFYSWQSYIGGFSNREYIRDKINAAFNASLFLAAIAFISFSTLCSKLELIDFMFFRSIVTDFN